MEIHCETKERKKVSDEQIGNYFLDQRDMHTHFPLSKALWTAPSENEIYSLYFVLRPNCLYGRFKRVVSRKEIRAKFDAFFVDHDF